MACKAIVYMRGAGIDWVLSNLPATKAELYDAVTIHVECDTIYLDTLLRDMRDAGLIACANGVWYTRTKPA